MKLRYKILAGLCLFLFAAVAALALVISYTTACPAQPATAAGTGGMQAIMARCYGSPDVLSLETIDKPAIDDDQALIKVHASTVNPSEWHQLRGSPYIARLAFGLFAPNSPRLGVDFAGTVEAVGSNVKAYAPDDAVFGGARGAFAEYVVIRETSPVVHMPDNVSFEAAATMGIAGSTALQAVRDHARVQAGEQILVNGASGGVGTMAVQIAKAFDAEVTGVCSTRNLDMVRSIGADHVIDYTQEDYTQGEQRYDVIIDMVGNHSVLANTKMLKPGGRMVLVGGPKGNWFAPLYPLVQTMVVAPFVEPEVGFFVANFDKDDFKLLAELMQSRQLVPVIDRRYPLSETAEAIRYSEAGHARGKIIIDIATD